MKSTKQDTLDKYYQAEQAFHEALTELVEEYIRLKADEPEYETIKEILMANWESPGFDKIMEEYFVEEYDKAIDDNVSQAELDELLDRIELELNRSFNPDYKGRLYEILMIYNRRNWE